MIIEEGETGYLIGSVAELPGCHTQAKAQDELLERIKEAIQVYLEATSEDTPPTRLIGIQRVAV